MGLRSPILPLGISAPGSAVQGGYVTLPWWRGGSSGGAVTQGGYVTLPWWQAGGSAAAPAGGGFITLPWWRAGAGAAAVEDRHAVGRIPWREWYVRTYTGWPEVKRVRREDVERLEAVLPAEEPLREALGPRLASLFVLPALGDVERAGKRLEAAYEEPAGSAGVEAAEHDLEEAVERLQWVLDEAIARADEEEAVALLLLSI